MTERVPLTILKNLVHNETYTRQVLPFIQPEYFEERSDRIVFEEVSKFLDEYDKTPTKEVLHIEVEKRVDVTEEEYKNIEQLISALDTDESESKWLLDTTEEWCKQRAIYLALIKSIQLSLIHI